MSLKKIAVILLCFAGMRVFASRDYSVLNNAGSSELIMLTEEEFSLIQTKHIESGRPSPFLERIKQKRSKNKKVTAALLAFPFPCGIVGLHRIYLGSAPYVPIVYIATIGGAFGILPFIDFCVLLIDSGIEPYINNNKVFMWVN